MARLSNLSSYPPTFIVPPPPPEWEASRVGTKAERRRGVRTAPSPASATPPGTCPARSRRHLRQLYAASERTLRHLRASSGGSPAADRLETSTKSQTARLDAANAGYRYVDIYALLLNPVDLRGIPRRDGEDRARWVPPAFLPPSDADGCWLVNLEEMPSTVLIGPSGVPVRPRPAPRGVRPPDSAALIPCGNRENDRGIVYRMPSPLASRFVHMEVRVDVPTGNGIAPETLFFRVPS